MACFASDNWSGAHPAVLEALAEANSGAPAVAYGGDPWTTRMEECFKAHFGPDATAFSVFTGTAANVLGLSLPLRPYQAVICADSAHIHVDECGAIERFAGLKLLPLPTADGKLTPDQITASLGNLGGDEHHPQPGAVSIAQVTETGVCYSRAELAAIAGVAHANGLYVHVDGARLSNAAVSLGCSLAEAAEGADLVSFGGTKNGLMGAEALVILRPGLSDTMRFVRMQGMQLGSKMRFLSAQLVALLEGDLWRRNATHANAMARRLADGIRGLPGIGIAYPVDSNAVFAVLRRDHIEKLRQDHDFHVWDEKSGLVRWMTAFDTNPDVVDAFVRDIVRVTAA